MSNRLNNDDFTRYSRREWLVTNGIGGFAMGTVAGVLTRRYHGLLVAALDPPLGRTVLVSRMEESVIHRGKTVPLSTNRWVDGSIDPEGYRSICSFRLEGTIPVWTFDIGDGRLEKRIWMEQGFNTTYVRYDLVDAAGPVILRAEPMVTYRDYHKLSGESVGDLPVQNVEGGIEVVPAEGNSFRIFSDTAVAETARERIDNLYLAVEAYRGLDDCESLLRAGLLEISIPSGGAATIVISTDPQPEIGAGEALVMRRRRDMSIITGAGALLEGAGELTDQIEQLVLAADQFMVIRRRADGTPGSSIIAGYPWFTDWGRDSMIALPGLTLCTGRSTLAVEVLSTFADHVSQGMIPNRFPDVGEEPEYNTADASLWFIEAMATTCEATDDEELLRRLYPALQEIIEWHMSGTRHNIHVDPRDGLLYAGEAGVQLTWMDAKVEDWVVTPRIGKPVEINALWYNALCTMADFAAHLGDPASPYEEAADQVRESFSRFWYEEGGYCLDLIDSPEGDHATLRPNQIFAVSLPNSPLNDEQQKGVVDICERYLFTPHGLRSLAPGEPDYQGRYGGDLRTRDGAYHQGTVWGWLIGPFVAAHLRVYRDRELARSFLLPLLDSLDEHGVGSLSEIFDGDAPFTARGCPSQAWTVAEVLRAWHLTA